MSTDIIFFAGLLLLGFMLGELFEFNLSIEKTLLYACGGVLLSGLIGLIIFSSISGAGIYTVVSEYVAKNLELTLVLYRAMGMSQENIQLISDSLNQIAHVLVTILPALVTMSTLFVAWTNILLARPILKKRSLVLPRFRTAAILESAGNSGMGGYRLRSGAVYTDTGRERSSA